MAPGSRSRSAARARRQLVRKAIGGSPTSSWKRRARLALYLAGAIVVTIAANVPLNDALAATHPDGAGAAASWHSYLSHWTAWNHLRAAAALAAAGLLTGALWLG